MNIAPGKERLDYSKNGDDEDFRRAEENQTFLMKLAKLNKLTWLNDGDEEPMSVTQLVGDMEVLIPMAGFIDKDAEVVPLRQIHREAGKRTGARGINFPTLPKSPGRPLLEKEKEKAGLTGYSKLKDRLKIKAL